MGDKERQLTVTFDLVFGAGKETGQGCQGRSHKFITAKTHRCGSSDKGAAVFSGRRHQTPCRHQKKCFQPQQHLHLGILCPPAGQASPERLESFHMTRHRFTLHPCFDPDETSHELSRLLVDGSIDDADLTQRIARLRERFRTYCAVYPFGIWGSGLVVTREMRALTDLLLPLGEIVPAFIRLFHRALRFTPFLEATPLMSATSWLDVLERLDASVAQADPARLLEQLAGDGGKRARFAFSLFIPRHYGGGFDRYPAQAALLKEWVLQKRTARRDTLTVLDAACGCGEGTYAVARLLLDAGLTPERFRVVGSSREEIELFAARHLYFPHDRRRADALRRFVAPLRASGATASIGFVREDIMDAEEGTWDVILCNGILGGPFIHDRKTLERTIERLRARLAPGGLILVADRFHDGWKKRVPAAMLEEILRSTGLTVLVAGEGIAGFRP